MRRDLLDEFYRESGEAMAFRPGSSQLSLYAYVADEGTVLFDDVAAVTRRMTSA